MNHTVRGAKGLDVWELARLTRYPHNAVHIQKGIWSKPQILEIGEIFQKIA